MRILQQFFDVLTVSWKRNDMKWYLDNIISNLWHCFVIILLQFREMNKTWNKKIFWTNYRVWRAFLSEPCPQSRLHKTNRRPAIYALQTKIEIITYTANLSQWGTTVCWCLLQDFLKYNLLFFTLMDSKPNSCIVLCRPCSQCIDSDSDPTPE